MPACCLVQQQGVAVTTALQLLAVCTVVLRPCWAFAAVLYRRMCTCNTLKGCMSNVIKAGFKCNQSRLKFMQFLTAIPVAAG